MRHDTHPAGLVSGLSVAEIRGSAEAMRHALAGIVERGKDVWDGPLPPLVAALEDLGRVDLCLARLVEGHADAVRIRGQAGLQRSPGVYGVWASRSVGTGLAALPENLGWRLRGELRFASGVDLIDRALTPGWLGPDEHRLFDIPAHRVVAHRDTWPTAAMDASRSFTVTVDLPVTECDQVGPPGHYLRRPGFAVGGLCVAAVWAGGAQRVVDLVSTGLSDFRPSGHQLRRVGLMEVDAWQASAAVRHAAARLEGADAARVALPGQTEEIARVRTGVVAACDRLLTHAAAVVGPGGLVGNTPLARTLGDLALYVRQHHLDAEAERLGAQALRSRGALG